MHNIAHLDAQDALDLNEPKLVGGYGPCSVEAAEVTQLPLWLTGEEAETLALLCASAGASAPGEERLLHKVGDLLRAFRR